MNIITETRIKQSRDREGAGEHADATLGHATPTEITTEEHAHASVGMAPAHPIGSIQE